MFELTSEWLKDCENHHRPCGENAKLNWYPTRLLRISDNNIQLVQCDRDTGLGPYATLSHCWGREEFFCLTLSTISQFLDGVSIDKLPLTFQDTFATVRALGISYVWIDCYCIIQGSEEDWRHEVGRMRDVYAHSVLNIAAADASSPYEGLFRIRQTLHTKTTFISWQPTNKADTATTNYKTSEAGSLESWVPHFESYNNHLF